MSGRKRQYTDSQAYRIAHAAGWDAGNRSMVKAGRTAWSDEDYAASVGAFEKVMRGMGK